MRKNQVIYSTTIYKNSTKPIIEKEVFNHSLLFNIKSQKESMIHSRYYSHIVQEAKPIRTCLLRCWLLNHKKHDVRGTPLGCKAMQIVQVFDSSACNFHVPWGQWWAPNWYPVCKTPWKWVFVKMKTLKEQLLVAAITSLSMTNS